VRGAGRGPGAVAHQTDLCYHLCSSDLDGAVVMPNRLRIAGSLVTGRKADSQRRFRDEEQE
jgi:hypothetical protein